MGLETGYRYAGDENCVTPFTVASLDYASLPNATDVISREKQVDVGNDDYKSDWMR